MLKHKYNLLLLGGTNLDNFKSFFERDNFNCKYYEIIFSYLVIVLMTIQFVFCFVNVS